jgi:hypothetical protein
MNPMHTEALARLRRDEASTEARKALLVRAARAERRAARANAAARKAHDRLMAAR